MASKSDQKKAAALAALMQSDTLSDAAQIAGISRRTLYEYLHSDTDFATAFIALRNQRIIAAMDEVEAHRARALAVVTGLLEDAETPAAVRLKAAQIVLQQASSMGDTVSRIAEKNLNELYNPRFDFSSLSF